MATRSLHKVMDKAAVLSYFDQLVEQKVVFYDPNPVIATREDNGIKFEFRITNAMRDKPMLSSLPTPPEEERSKSQLPLQPGSDISVVGFEVHSINETHLLAFNKFSAFRPHFLFLTHDGYRRQYEALDLDDLKAAHEVICSLGDEYLVFFNCGIDAGCSRLHKHLQAIPLYGTERAPWENILQTEGRGMPFRSFFQAFGDQMPAAAELKNIYDELLSQAEATLGEAGRREGRAAPHNVLMDRKGILVIPRRAAGIEEVAVNAPGMLGLIWMSDKNMLTRFDELGPANVLEAAGVPMLRGS